MKWFFKILAFLALISEAVDFVQDDWAAFGVGGFVLVLSLYWEFDFFKDKTAERLDRSELRHRFSLRDRHRICANLPSGMSRHRLANLVVLYLQRRYPKGAGYRVRTPRVYPEDCLSIRSTLLSSTRITLQEHPAKEAVRPIILFIERYTLYHTVYKVFCVLCVLVAVFAALFSLSEQYKDEVTVGTMVFGIIAATSLLLSYAIGAVSARRWFPTDRQRLLQDDLAWIIDRAHGSVIAGASAHSGCQTSEKAVDDYTINYALALATQHRERMLSRWNIAVRWLPPCSPWPWC